jgi:hypothetical protein
MSCAVNFVEDLIEDNFWLNFVIASSVVASRAQRAIEAAPSVEKSIVVATPQGPVPAVFVMILIRGSYAEQWRHDST